MACNPNTKKPHAIQIHKHPGVWQFSLMLPVSKEVTVRVEYDKRDDFNFPIVNFPFICSNIPAEPAYGVDISQLIRYFRSFVKRIFRNGCPSHGCDHKTFEEMTST